jgi:lysozyme
MDNKSLLLLAAVGVAIWWYERQHADSSDPQSEDLIDSTMTKFDEATSLIYGAGPIGDMSMSNAGLAMLRGRERCRLTPYQLGDGGWTIGWGHQYGKYEFVPASITQEQADAMFVEDVVERGERWVKLYVTAPLTQYQFDALVHIAYNMSPQSFKKFAAEVNAGNGIDDIAMASVSWVREGLQNGIRNRRYTEMNLFNDGAYA